MKTVIDIIILTLVDFATCYPEAVPLKNIDTETVAEALVDIFNRLGVPEEILSDLGKKTTQIEFAWIIGD